MSETINFPLPTGAVVRLLQVPEHKVTNQIRLGKVNVPSVCGRRLWHAAQVLEVAKILGKDTPEIRNACRQAVDAQS